MNYLNKTKYILIALGVAFVLQLGACKKNESTTSNLQSADQLLSKDSSTSTFYYAVQKAGMQYFTQGGGPFTFFVPTNDAMANYGISRAVIDGADSSGLRQFVMNHIQAGLRTFTEIPIGPNANMTQQSSFAVYASRYTSPEAAYINGRLLLDKGTTVSNGIIYKLNGPLFLPAYNGYDALLQYGYKRMYQAVAKTTTSSSFTASPSTIFAVPDAAMVAAGYDSTTIANITGAAATTLSNRLKYHVLTNRVFAPDFKNNTAYVTRYGATFKVTSFTTSGLQVKGAGNTVPINVSQKDIVISNGVIHQVDSLLRY